MLIERIASSVVANLCPGAVWAAHWKVRSNGVIRVSVDKDDDVASGMSARVAKWQNQILYRQGMHLVRCTKSSCGCLYKNLRAAISAYKHNKV